MYIYVNDEFPTLGADWSAVLWNQLRRHPDVNGNVSRETSSTCRVWSDIIELLFYQINIYWTSSAKSEGGNLP